MFLFTHIEKCGGTSFHEILLLTYPRYFHITKNKFDGNETRNDLTIEQFKKILRYFPSGIGGHNIRPYLEFLPQSKRITFLRNPIERYLSHFNHMLEVGRTDSIEGFLENDYYNNFMVTKIAGNNDYLIAEKILEGFDFIGNTNNYNKSLNCLQDTLNVKLVGNLDQKNQRNNSPNYLRFSDLSTRQKFKVEENNRFDIRLYEKFILQSSVIDGYSGVVDLKNPSKLRLKFTGKLNKYKKKQIINPIRLT